LRREPLAVRKATLASLLARVAPGLRFNEHMDDTDGPLVFQHACKLGLEGIVSKRKDSPLPLEMLAGLDQEQEPYRARGEAGGRGGLGGGDRLQLKWPRPWPHSRSRTPPHRCVALPAAIGGRSKLRSRYLTCPTSTKLTSLLKNWADTLRYLDFRTATATPKTICPPLLVECTGRSKCSRPSCLGDWSLRPVACRCSISYLGQALKSTSVGDDDRSL